MALDRTNNYLETLINAGADAQSNLYEAVFTFHNQSPNKNDASLSNALTVRCKGFTPPAKSQGDYPVKYLTATIDRPQAKVNVTRNFNIQFRVDANYEVYEALLKQQNITFNPAKSFVATDILALKDKLFDVSINIVDEGVTDSNPESSNLFNYRNCWIAKIDPLRFNADNSQPIVVSLTINFLESEDWQTMLI